jgi:hypothetical protein
MRRREFITFVSGALAVERPTEFKVIVNLKRAKEIGITMPPLCLPAPMR